ncbi:hypothetical protein ACET3Z_021333 [Daucus carota]
MPNRDDFGLPKPDLASEDPFKDKMKGKIQGSSSQSKKAEDEAQVLGLTPKPKTLESVVWVQKTPQPQPAMDAADASVSPPQNPNNLESHAVAKNAPNSSCPDSPWTEVKRKGRASPGLEEGSPTPPNTFKGLRNVDEVEKILKDPAKLSKHQLKKLKKQLGKSSPSSAH